MRRKGKSMLDRMITRVFVMVASLLIVVGPKLHASQKDVDWERLMPAVAALVQ